jgi:hypothetical protein
MATESGKKATPTWSDVKANLADLDRLAMLALVQDMYAASKDNQAFLHARFDLGADILKPYKATIARWLWPDLSRGQVRFPLFFVFQQTTLMRPAFPDSVH